MLTQNLNVRADKKSIVPVAHMVQGDSGRRLTCIVQDYDIPSGSTASLSVVRPDGNVYTTTATISNNNVSAVILSDMLDVPGIVKATMHIFTSGLEVSTFIFAIKVDEKAGAGIEPSPAEGNAYVYINGQKTRVLTEADIENIGSKTRIDFDGANFKIDGRTLTYKELHDIHLVENDFCFVVYGDRAYLLSYVQDDPSAMREMRFQSVIATTDASSNLSNVKVSGIYVRSSNGTSIACISVVDVNSENSAYKATEINDQNKESGVWYPSNKAVNDFVEGKISPLSESIIKIEDDVDNIDERVAILEETTIVTKTGNKFENVEGNSEVNWQSATERRVVSYSKNMFPKIGTVGVLSNSPMVTNVEAVDDHLSATIQQGATYKLVTSKPILLKAGTYSFGASFEIVSGSATGNIGFIYISLCTKDGSVTTNQWNSIALNASRTTASSVKTLASDSYLVFQFYVNLNGTVSSELTLRWYDLAINAENTWSSYEPFDGQVQDGTSGTLNRIDNMNVISDSDVTISYYVKAPTPIACWGDSLTNGTGSTTGKPSSDTNPNVSYPSVLSRMLGREVKNFGVGGEPSWMISARSGHNEISVEPFTIPSGVTATRVYLRGQEQDYFWDNTQNKWTYSKDNLSYNIAVDDTYSGVNPCFIDGIKGSLTRTLISSGQPDPDTGETVQGSTFAYYFTRSESGTAKTLVCRTPIITDAYLNYDNAIKVIWMGQNDAPLHDGRYVVQGNAQDRARAMCKEKYIVMSLPTGDASGNATREQAFSAMFGSNYLNIRDYIIKNGITYANSLGAGITVSASDQALIDVGTIPSCLRIDGVHGNYWYYQIVAKAVYDKGKSLGYWE